MTPSDIATVAGGVVVVSGFLGKIALSSSRAITRLEQTVKTVEGRSTQLIPNGGSSLADAVRRMESQLAGMREDSVQVRERLAVVETLAKSADHQARNARQAVDGLVYLLPRRSGDTAAPSTF